MVLPGVPHHVTQRGNRRERTLFEDGDYALNLDLLADGAERNGVEVGVHSAAVRQSLSAFPAAAALAQAHWKL